MEGTVYGPSCLTQNSEDVKVLQVTGQPQPSADHPKQGEQPVPNGLHSGKQHLTWLFRRKSADLVELLNLVFGEFDHPSLSWSAWL